MWFVVVFLAFVIPMALFHDIELYRSYKKYTNNIINHDASFQEFIYKVDKCANEIWRLLREQTIHTSTKYRFNEAEHTITFYSELPDGSLDVTYLIYVSEYDGYSILKIVQTNRFLEKKKYAYLQNEFWSQLLEAVPIPYTQ